MARGGASFVHGDADRWLAVAWVLKAGYIIDVHSHGSSTDARASDADILVGRRLSMVAKAWRIPLLDAVSVADGQACSLAANGLLDGAEETGGSDEEPLAVLDAREKWKLAFWVLGPDRTLQSLVLDEAHKARVPAEDWLFEHLRGMTRLGLAGLAACDPRPALVSDALSGPDEKVLLDALLEEAADRGLSAWDCGYAMGREGLLQGLRARLAAKEARIGSAKDDFNSGAVERVAAVAEST